MTSRDPIRSRSWPRYLWISISRLPCEIHGQFILTTSRKPHIDVTWPERSKSWPQYLWSLISQKTVRDRRSVVIDHLQETSCCESNGHVRDDVTWHQRSRSWPRYLWRSISRQPCEIHGQFILTNNKKTHIGNPVITLPMTSLDQKGERRDHNTFEA